ncbi:MAG TPA: hypothetical protein VLM76_04890 [Patescibacteria group bacterium]|nr:hypothetical protein [Patescibacteria group bacterium]
MIFLPELLADAVRRDHEREVSLASERRRLARLFAAAARCCRMTLASRFRAALRGSAPDACLLA